MLQHAAFAAAPAPPALPGGWVPWVLPNGVAIPVMPAAQWFAMAGAPAFAALQPAAVLPASGPTPDAAAAAAAAAVTVTAAAPLALLGAPSVAGAGAAPAM